MIYRSVCNNNGVGTAVLREDFQHCNTDEKVTRNQKLHFFIRELHEGCEESRPTLSQNVMKILYLETWGGGLGTLTFKGKNLIYGKGGHDSSAIPSRLVHVSSYTNKWHITGIISPPPSQPNSQS
jgi:hypothetical protein